MKLLVTSRACLRLAAEHEYSLPTLTDEEAVELFAGRARAAKPGFEPDEHVPQICRRLDNLPLALELAAARIRLLTPEVMLARLERRLPLLTGGARDAPERQRTLRAAIDWSYGLLDESEQEAFPRLAVFAGSFDLDAAERISGAGIDPLQGLVEKSLVRQTQEGRFFMLETVREYAEEVLVANNDDRETRRRHAAQYLKLAKESDQPIRDGPELAALERMRLEHDNCRAALEFLLAVDDAAGALRLVSSLGFFWYVTGQLREARSWFDRALDLPVRGSQVARARALNTAAGIAMHSGDAAGARTYTEQALVVWRELGETDAVVRSLNELSNAALRENQLAEAATHLDEALRLAKTLDDPLWVALLQANTGEVKLFEGRIAEARELFQNALECGRRHDYMVCIGWSLLGLATVELADQRITAAEQAVGEALSLAEELGYMDLIGGCLDVAWFLGAADAIDAATGSARRLAPVVEQLVRAAREKVGDATFDRARQTGSSATAETALAAAHDYLD
jgi:tetratricopeptide (TPR) repeat protein